MPMFRAWMVVFFMWMVVAGCSTESASTPTDVEVDSAGDAITSTDVTSDAAPDLAWDTGEEDVVPWTPPGARNLLQYVDPLIGTAGPGNVIPGPARPHSAVKLSPDTVEETGSIDAYDYGSGSIEGFSHTHLEGPGGSGNGYSEILLIPTVGELQTATKDYASAYSHDDESVSAGYYQVKLSDYNVNVELTSTNWAGFHRYHFPATESAWVLLDVGHTRGESLSGQINVEDNQTISGYGFYNMHPQLLAATSLVGQEQGERTVYFYARFNQPFVETWVWNGETPAAQGTDIEGAKAGVAAAFTFSEESTVEVTVAISFVSVDMARQHLEDEIGERSFEEIRTEAEGQWNALLNRVHVEGGEEGDLVRFYTAIYHSVLAPSNLTEKGKFWIGFSGEGKVKDALDFQYYADDWCIWDTYRTTHPLQLLLEPEIVDDELQSMVEMYKDGGWIPKCPWHATGYSRVMIGNHSTCIFADSWFKGFHEFDVEKAYEGMQKNADEDDVEGIPAGVLGYFNYGTLPSYIQKGYVPWEDDETQATSMTLEFAYNDWCLGRIAQSMDKAADATRYMKRANNWKNHMDSETGFMRSKKRSGAWLTPFDPTGEDGFCEADSWIYTWFVPHDPQGLVDAMGGAEAFAEKLDEFFDAGHFDPTNEPDFHAPFFYNYVGKPAKTQERVLETMESEYTTTPGGLPGNDDAGATSAWFVFSAMGLYPFAPGEPNYSLTTPLFDSISIFPDGLVEGGRHLVIRAEGRSTGMKYISGASLGGTPLTAPTLDHNRWFEERVLEFHLSDSPASWEH